LHKEARRAAGFSDVELRYLETGTDLLIAVWNITLRLYTDIP